MRAIRMHSKFDIHSIVGTIGGFIAFIKGVPYMMNFIQFLDAGWWHTIATKSIEVIWAGFVAGVCAIVSWFCKKAAEENWPKIKAYFKSKKRK